VLGDLDMSITLYCAYINLTRIGEGKAKVKTKWVLTTHAAGIEM
jgi:hypothetical protein